MGSVPPGQNPLDPTTYAAPRSGLAIRSGSTIGGVRTAGSNPLAPTTPNSHVEPVMVAAQPRASATDSSLSAPVPVLRPRHTRPAGRADRGLRRVLVPDCRCR